MVDLGCLCGHAAEVHVKREVGRVAWPGPRGACAKRGRMTDVLEIQTGCGCLSYRPVPLGELGTVEEAAGW